MSIFIPHCVVSPPCCQKNRHQVWRLEVKKLKILAVLHLSFWRSLDFCFVPLGGDGCECLFLALLKGEICWFTHAAHIRTFLSKWDLLKSHHFFNSHLTLCHDPSLTLQSLPFSMAADLGCATYCGYFPFQCPAPWQNRWKCWWWWFQEAGFLGLTAFTKETYVKCKFDSSTICMHILYICTYIYTHAFMYMYFHVYILYCLSEWNL